MKPEDAGVGEVEDGIPIPPRSGGIHLGPVARRLMDCNPGGSFRVESLKQVKAAQTYAYRKDIDIEYRGIDEPPYKFRIWRKT